MTEPTVEQWSSIRQKMVQLKLAEDRERCEGSLLEFFKGAWPSVDAAVFKPSWAIEAMCDHLEAVAFGHIRRLLINVPPRCSKTTLCSVVFPAWVWSRSEISFLSGPQVRFLCASYNHDLTLTSATQTRRLFNSPWYDKLWPGRIKFREDQNAKFLYENTAGGARFSTSVGGSLLGRGGDILIGDDLNKTGGSDDDEPGETDAERSSVASFWKEFSSTRMNDPKQSALIVIQQRVHEEDVSGMILDDDEEDWVHLMIPMRYEADRHCVTVKLPQYDTDQPWEDPRTEEGQLLWEDRFGEKEVKSLERTLGPYMSAGRLQQSPSPKGGGIIKSDWWQLWDQQEARKYGLEWNENGLPKEFPETPLVVASLDTSYGEKEENDYNALTVWGIWTDRGGNRRAMLMYAWQKRLPLHGVDIVKEPGELKHMFEARKKENWGLVEWVADTCKRYRVRRLLIEDKTRGKDVAAELKRLYARENWGIELLPVVGDKVSRTHAVVPLFTDNCVWAPNLKWAQDVILQSQRFPKTKHDDLHDTVTQFLNWARRVGVLGLAEETAAELEESSMYSGDPRNSISAHYGI